VQNVCGKDPLIGLGHKHPSIEFHTEKA